MGFFRRHKKNNDYLIHVDAMLKMSQDLQLFLPVCCNNPNNRRRLKTLHGILSSFRENVGYTINQGG